MINKQQFVDLKALLAKETTPANILPAAQTLLGLDPRNPSQVAKLLNELKLGEADLAFDEGVAIVKISGGTGRHTDQAVALLRAVVDAIDLKALDAVFPEKKTRSPEKAMTPERGFTRPMGRG